MNTFFIKIPIPDTDDIATHSNYSKKKIIFPSLSFAPSEDKTIERDNDNALWRKSSMTISVQFIIWKWRQKSTRRDIKYFFRNMYVDIRYPWKFLVCVAFKSIMNRMFISWIIGLFESFFSTLFSPLWDCIFWKLEFIFRFLSYNIEFSSGCEMPSQIVFCRFQAKISKKKLMNWTIFFNLKKFHSIWIQT